MARGTLSIALFPKEPKRSRHVLLHPFPLRIRVCEDRDAVQFQGPITVPPADCLEFGIFFRRNHIIISCIVLHGHDARWPLLDLLHSLGDGSRHFEDDGEERLDGYFSGTFSQLQSGAPYTPLTELTSTELRLLSGFKMDRQPGLSSTLYIHQPGGRSQSADGR